MAHFSTAKLAGILCVMSAAITLGAWKLNDRAVEALVKDTATQNSIDAATYIADKMPNMAHVLAGNGAPLEDVAFMQTVIAAKGIDTFKLYDRRGYLVFDSSLHEQKSSSDNELGKHNPSAFAALTGMTDFVKLEEETEESGSTTLLSETYVPLRKGGELTGVAEVYIDQTATVALFRKSFALFSALIAGLVCLSFTIPAFGFLRRTRQKQRADEDIHFMEHHDKLTRLPNRARFVSLVAAEALKRANTQELVAVHFIDLDLFKDVNDTHGHDIGDEVLRAVASRLSGVVRETDFVARIGADEFVIAQCGLPGHVELADLTKRVIDVFRDPIRLPSRDIAISASVGTAVGLCATANPDELIDNADTAAYVVKARGRNGHCFFEAKFVEERREYMQLEALLRSAVTSEKLELHYQPLFSFEGSKLKGFEALLRMRDEAGAFVSPVKFIPIAEEIGLIDEIGRWVLHHACATAKLWPGHLKISVNLSPSQFKRHSVVAATRSALEKSGLEPSRLLLEITESTLLSSTESVISQLQELKALGTSIVMDDFGTGYSSLGYMLKFPFDHIKIDRSFVKAISDGNDSATTVIETIIALGHTLKMTVTAEGVETEEQAEKLRGMNCDHVQGFLFGKPMPAEDIAPLLMRGVAAHLADPQDGSPAQAELLFG